MDFNPFLNKLITERNSAVVEDPLVDLLAEMVKAIVRLEAQQETPASAIQASPNGSVVIERQGETRRILTTSSALSFPVSRDGIDLPLVTQAITDWVSSQWLVGGALEVEIGLTFTSKGRIRPAGSVSPSTTLTPQPEIASNSSSGAHGMDARPESLSASGPDSPASSPEPAQGGSEAAARMLNEEATGNTIAQEEQR